MAHETPEKSTRRILLADDDAQTRLSLEYILEAARYEVSVAEDGAAALALLDDLSERGVAVDLVITDLQMPELDGLAVIHGVRARQPELPSIVITGLRAPGVREQLEPHDRVALLQKPIDDEVLLKTISRLLSA